jgi:hypothetical protein
MVKGGFGISVEKLADALYSVLQRTKPDSDQTNSMEKMGTTACTVM